MNVRNNIKKVSCETKVYDKFNFYNGMEWNGIGSAVIQIDQKGLSEWKQTERIPALKLLNFYDFVFSGIN